MVQHGGRRADRFWSDGSAMFMIAFSLIVMGAASQLGGLVGVAGMLVACATIAWFVWDTLVTSSNG